MDNASISTLQTALYALFVVLGVSAAIAIIIAIARYHLFQRDSGTEAVTRRIVNVCSILVFISIFGSVSVYATDTFVSSNPIAQEIQNNAGTDKIPKAIGDRIERYPNLGALMEKAKEELVVKMAKEETQRQEEERARRTQTDPTMAADGGAGNYYNADPNGIWGDSIANGTRDISFAQMSSKNASSMLGYARLVGHAAAMQFNPNLANQLVLDHRESQG